MPNTIGNAPASSTATQAITTGANGISDEYFRRHMMPPEYYAEKLSVLRSGKSISEANFSDLLQDVFYLREYSNANSLKLIPREMLSDEAKWVWDNKVAIRAKIDNQEPLDTFDGSPIGAGGSSVPSKADTSFEYERRNMMPAAYYAERLATLRSGKAMSEVAFSDLLQDVFYLRDQKNSPSLTHIPRELLSDEAKWVWDNQGAIRAKIVKNEPLDNFEYSRPK